MDMKSNVNSPNAKSFFVTFLPLFLLFSAIAIIFGFQELKSQNLILKSKERQNVETLRRIANDDVKTIILDLFLLSVHPALHQMMENDNPTTRQNLAATFKAFCEHTKLYDQIRFLDETGLERVRINFAQDRPHIVANDKLQNKAKRYYFEDTFKLEPGRVFVSPFDLNIENGQIELPLKPMIRFGTPVVDLKNRKHGIVLLNYLGAKLIHNLNQSSSDSMGSLMFLNSKGYWLKGLKPEDEWGFMFKDRKNLTFAHQYPKSWEKINTREEGQFRNEQGIFTFTTSQPLSRNMPSSTGSNKAFNSSDADLSGIDEYWKIVSLVTKETLNERKIILILKWLPLYGLTTLLIALASWGLSHYAIQRKQAMEERFHREKLQGVLELAGAACHELNQPMQALVGYCDLLMMDVDENNTRVDKIEKITAQAERIRNITKKLANITKYETTNYLDTKIIDIDKSSV